MLHYFKPNEIDIYITEVDDSIFFLYTKLALMGITFRLQGRSKEFHYTVIYGGKGFA